MFEKLKLIDFCITEEYTILDTLKKINNLSTQFVLVCSSKNELLGTVTDGDIRRALLDGYGVNDIITSAMNPHPIFSLEEEEWCIREEKILKSNINFLPIINEQNEIVSILGKKRLEHPSSKKNYVVLMAGGLGERLRPLTENTPKPMLPIGGKPILEHTINQFKLHGFTNFLISVNYKKEQIIDYFGDGTSMGIKIKYLEETERLGTAGALALIQNSGLETEDSIFVMNGDLMADIDFSDFLKFHEEKGTDFSIGVKDQKIGIPFGVVSYSNDLILESIEEKPYYSYSINSGIYIINPTVLNFLSDSNKYLDMPDLLISKTKQGLKGACYSISSYWRDIGNITDYNLAHVDWEQHKASQNKSLIVFT